MTTEQLAKANELNTKIKQASDLLAKLKKSDAEVKEKKAEPTSISISYLVDNNGKRFEFSPAWISNKDIKADAMFFLNEAKDKMISCLEAYIAVMQKELETL